MSAGALIDAYAAAWSSKDPAAFAPLCAPDVHYEDPLTAPLTGPDALARHAGRLWAAFPDARFQAAGPQMTGERHIAAPLKLVATHRGELEGLPPTGRFLSAHVMAVCELTPEEDLLWRVRTFFDPYDAGVQLGVLPERGSLGGKAMLMLRGFGVRARG